MARVVWFSATREGGQTAIVLYVRGMSEENHRLLATPLSVLVDNAVGELAAACIGSVDLAPCPDDPAASGLQLLSELSSVARSLSQSSGTVNDLQ